MSKIVTIGGLTHRPTKAIVIGSMAKIEIRVDIFERAFKRFQKVPGANFASLASKIKVPVAELRRWREEGALPEEKLPALAGALDVNPERLMRSSDGEIPNAAMENPVQPRKIGHNILTVARTFRSYSRFLGYQKIHPDFPHSHSINHPGNAAFYATFIVEASAASQKWLFSVWFGLRMDYGMVELKPNGDVYLSPILQDQPADSTEGFSSENDEGVPVVCVRTWFGRPACDFIIHSDRPFQVKWTEKPIDVPGAVSFLKNPFQRDE